MSLHLCGSDIIHMDRGTFMWIQLTHFAIDADEDDRTLLSALIATPGYAHDYASPFDPDALDTDVHGRWPLDRIHVDLFTPSSVTDAVSRLQSWADEQEWTDPEFRQPPEVQRRLHEVYRLLGSGNVYRLHNPRPEDEIDHPATGDMGFHEFVVMDRGTRSVHVVVASDD